MKNSQLRKIIKESIKELMNEQSSNARAHNVHTCVGNNGATGVIRNLTVDNQVPVVGQTFNCTDLGSAGGILSSNSANMNAGNFCKVGTERPQYLSGGQTDVTSASPPPPGTAGCPASSTSTSGCDSSAWSNHANWTATFTNTVSNHNNPCNFLDQKLTQFTNQISSVGPVWANILQCKLDLINQLHSQNNC